MIEEEFTAGAPRGVGMPHARRSTAPAVLIGIGLGGFLDGIVLHQVLQWHNMGSAVLAPTTMDAMSRNMMWDGFFHLTTWTVVIAGIYALLRDVRRGWGLPSTKAFTGLLLVGWGTFNLVEGTIDHHILELPHVRDLPTHVPIYDWGFLLIGGMGLVALGSALAGRAERWRT